MNARIEHLSSCNMAIETFVTTENAFQLRLDKSKITHIILGKRAREDYNKSMKGVCTAKKKIFNIYCISNCLRL